MQPTPLFFSDNVITWTVLLMIFVLVAAMWFFGFIVHAEEKAGWRYYCEQHAAINWTDSESDELEYAKIQEHCM